MSNNSLIIPFPSAPYIEKEKHCSKEERVAMYDIIMKIFNYKDTYYKAVKSGKKDEYSYMNLSNFKVYNNLINEINQKISDPFMRDFTISTLANIKKNDTEKESVKETYKTVREWFYTDSQKGQMFRNNLALPSTYESINFRYLFELCNTQAITSKSAIFEPVKNKYNIFNKEFENLLK